MKTAYIGSFSPAAVRLHHTRERSKAIFPKSGEKSKSPMGFLREHSNY